MTRPSRCAIEVSCTVDSLSRLNVLKKLSPASLKELGVESNVFVKPDSEAETDDASTGLEGVLEPPLSDEARVRIDRAIETCLAVYRPRGVYKVFNPVTCTLPPEYTEPAIKVIGTMMMFKGQTIYERLRKALHCALMAVTLGPENPVALSGAVDELDRQIADACALALVERAADNLSAVIVNAALEEDLYTDDRLSPGEGDFPLETRSQIVFYAQTEKLLDLHLDSEGEFSPRCSTVGIIGMFDPAQKNRKRACGRCRYRSFCSIRAVGMNCHGGKGSFKKKEDSAAD